MKILPKEVLDLRKDCSQYCYRHIFHDYVVMTIPATITNSPDYLPLPYQYLDEGVTTEAYDEYFCVFSPW